MRKYAVAVLLLFVSALSFAQDNAPLVSLSKDSVETCYQSGVDLFSDGRYEEAVVMLRKAAESGHADAQYDYGLCCFNGNGITEDKDEAVVWFRKAAFQGLPVAQYTMGNCYEYGYGVEQSSESAVEWYMASMILADRAGVLQR